LSSNVGGVSEEERDSGFEREPDVIPGTDATKPGSDFSWSLAVFLLIGLGFVVFAVQNTIDVQVSFLAWEFDVSLPLLLVVTALIAVIADEIVGLIRRRRRRRRNQEREELKRYRGT
jgi:uncharacterized integral membrane protein